MFDINISESLFSGNESDERSRNLSKYDLHRKAERNTNNGNDYINSMIYPKLDQLSSCFDNTKKCSNSNFPFNCSHVFDGHSTPKSHHFIHNMHNEPLDLGSQGSQIEWKNFNPVISCEESYLNFASNGYEQRSPPLKLHNSNIYSRKNARFLERSRIKAAVTQCETLILKIF